MKHHKNVEKLKQASCKKDFVKACESIVKDADYVKIDHKALESFANAIRKPAFVPNWHDYLSDSVTKKASPKYIKDKEFRLKRAFFELALSCSVNAGYTSKGIDGKTTKWEKDGSGAAALMKSFDYMWKRNIVPGIHLHDPFVAVSESQLAFSADPAFSEKRAEILSSFTGSRPQDVLFHSLDVAKNSDDSYKVDFDQFSYIGFSNYEGFAEDPFWKKAALLQIMFAGFAESEGVDVELDTIIPADYRIPQTWHNAGVLRFSDHLVQKIESDYLFGEDDQEVTEVRAASVVVAERILKLVKPRLKKEEGFNYQINHLDADLWFAGRLFDKKPNELDPKKQKIRAAYEAIGKNSGFCQLGFNKKTSRAMNVFTMRF
jgi:hypothetical protein